jgi:hypothetical protein
MSLPEPEVAGAVPLAEVVEVLSLLDFARIFPEHVNKITVDRI